MIQVRQGPGGGGQGGQQGGQSNPNQATSSVVQVNPTLTVVSTSTASPTSTGTPTSTAKSTSTTAASSSSGSQKGAIIGGVLGGIGGLLIIVLIAICLLQRRKKKSLKEKHGSAQPVTYTGLNAAFAGVPFRQQPNTPHADDRLLATGTMYPSAEPSPTGLGIRGGGDTSPYSTPGMEADPFLPSYAQSQSGVSSGGRNSFGQLNSVNTSISSPSTADVSPMSAHPSPSPMSAHAHPSGRSVLPPPIPQFANAMAVSSIPEVDSPRFQLEHRDTMGFPVDSDSPEIPSTPYQEIPLAAPAPRHPLIHQDSLERVVRQGMSTPEPGTLAPTNPLLQQPRHSGPVSRLLSGQYPATESPVLGMQNPVTIHAPQPAALHPSGLGRNVSQRTVSSVSSMGPSVISDTELERLGVGPGGRF